ncbi:hypothetical protein Tco_0007831 [Tanacetum coccineum]
MTYGPKQTYTSDSEPKTIDLNSCESNSSVESLEFMPKPVIIKPKTSGYASCMSNLSAKSPEFFPKSVCARNESVRKADNSRKNNKSPRGYKVQLLAKTEVLVASVVCCRESCGGLHVAVKEYAFGFKVLLFNPLVLSKTDLSRNLKYVVPTGRVKVLAGRYVVPTGKDNVIVR